MATGGEHWGDLETLPDYQEIDGDRLRARPPRGPGSSTTSPAPVAGRGRGLREGTGVRTRGHGRLRELGRDPAPPGHARPWLHAADQPLLALAARRRRLRLRRRRRRLFTTSSSAGSATTTSITRPRSATASTTRFRVSSSTRSAAAASPRRCSSGRCRRCVSAASATPASISTGCARRCSSPVSRPILDQRRPRAHPVDRRRADRLQDGDLLEPAEHAVGGLRPFLRGRRRVLRRGHDLAQDPLSGSTSPRHFSSR